MIYPQLNEAELVRLLWLCFYRYDIKRSEGERFYEHLSWYVEDRNHIGAFCSAIDVLSTLYFKLKLAEYPGVFRAFEFRIMEYLLWYFEADLVGEFLSIDSKVHTKYLERSLRLYRGFKLSERVEMPWVHGWMWKRLMRKVKGKHGKKPKKKAEAHSFCAYCATL